MPWISNAEARAWQEGQYHESYHKLGAHPDATGCWFAVWAPHADAIAVIGDFNAWSNTAHWMNREGAGIWTCYVEGAQVGQRYKYHIKRGDYITDKTDPFAFQMEAPRPQGSDIDGLSSIIADLSGYQWQDDAWMKSRKGPSGINSPISVYEVHLGSWMTDDHGNPLNYRQIAQSLADYVSDMGFTHIEVLPLMEHPYYGSWGYQTIGYFAPTHRYGSPEDLKYFVDYMHQRGIGIILDWVPAHFAVDPQGLVFFDGSTLFEYDDPQMRQHPDWGTYIFDYNKPGVRNFLMSNALFWLDEYHIDGLRFDAVASLLYRDYSRTEWSPNQYGGRENLEAIDFLKKVNEVVYNRFPEALMIAEESTAWPGVSKPTYDNGLGFLYKWNMGWMHDTLKYIEEDPVHRAYHHNNLTFPLFYAFSEQYMLPLSHDEVVHGKGSLWGKMPGDLWQKAANLRLLYGHMFGHPGKKLLFMGCEFGQPAEWNYKQSLDWGLLEYPHHKGLQKWVKALNTLYRTYPSLGKDSGDAFFWIDHTDAQHSLVSYVRHLDDEMLVFVLNFTPVPRDEHLQGMPKLGTWEMLLNSDDPAYGGSGYGTPRANVKVSDKTPHQGQPGSIKLTVPPLGLMVFKHKPAKKGKGKK